MIVSVWSYGMAAKAAMAAAAAHLLEAKMRLMSVRALPEPGACLSQAAAAPQGLQRGAWPPCVSSCRRPRACAPQDGLVLAPLGQLGSSLLPLTGIGYLLASVVLFTQVQLVQHLTGSELWQSARERALAWPQDLGWPVRQGWPLSCPEPARLPFCPACLQKDAAKRGRLGASTFRALNAGERLGHHAAAAMWPGSGAAVTGWHRPAAVSPPSPSGLAIAALVNATSMAAWWQAGVLAHTKLAVLKIGMHALLGGLALYNLAFAKKKK